MKAQRWIVIALFLIALALSAAPARAEEPQPYLYAMVKCSGLPVPTLVQAQQEFDTQYGFDHSLTTMDQWRSSYESRANEFASLLGCPSVLDDGRLTRWYQFYTPTYSRILRNIPK